MYTEADLARSQMVVCSNVVWGGVHVPGSVSVSECVGLAKWEADGFCFADSTLR